MTAATAIAFAAAVLPQASPFEADLSLAFGAAGMTLDSARLDLDTLAFYRQAAFPNLWAGRLQARPWRAEFENDMLRRQLSVAKASPGQAVELGSRMLGKGTRLALLGDPAAGAAQAAADADGLSRVLARMQQAGVVSQVPSNLSSAPEEVRKAAAAVLSAALERHEAFRAAVSAVSDLAGHRAAWNDAMPDFGSPAASVKAVRLCQALDLPSLFAAGQGVGYAVSWAEARARLVDPGIRYRVEFPTAWGRVVLSGGTDDRYEGPPPLLVIDSGGNDTYVGQPNTGPGAAWLSVVLDTAGDDRYLGHPDLAGTEVRKWEGRKAARGKPGPGSATFGATFLVDSSGDDLYRAAGRSFGSATFGVSVLLDLAGSDRYDAYADSLGYAWFGVGVLEDLGGDDQYRVFTQGQGCGLAMGFGALIDRGGGDAYVAEDEVLDFPSPQSAQHNVSLAQGAGYGIRADFSTGTSLAGGIGVLLDEAGNDTYSCGVFGQGTGYWDGVGALWDMGGDDQYRGQWYVMGASAHFGVGYLEDAGGNDSYWAGMNMALGAGHDFGLGYLLDQAGDDTYQGPNLSLGAGNANGHGVFFDGGGDDAYSASGLALGSAAEGQKASLRERAASFGVFIDHSGNDAYPDGLAWARNASKQVNWASRQDTAETSQLGIFLDRP